MPQISGPRVPSRDQASAGAGPHDQYKLFIINELYSFSLKWNWVRLADFAFLACALPGSAGESGRGFGTTNSRLHRFQDNDRDQGGMVGRRVMLFTRRELDKLVWA